MMFPIVTAAVMNQSLMTECKERDQIPKVIALTGKAYKVKYTVLIEHEEKRTVAGVIPSNGNVRSDQHYD